MNQLDSFQFDKLEDYQIDPECRRLENVDAHQACIPANSPRAFPGTPTLVYDETDYGPAIVQNEFTWLVRDLHLRFNNMVQIAADDFNIAMRPMKYFLHMMRHPMNGKSCIYIHSFHQPMRQRDKDQKYPAYVH